MEWGQELETQYRKYEFSNPVTSTLAKRPAASRQKADAGEPPAKKAKAGGGGGIDDVKQQYENGNLSKVCLFFHSAYL